MKFDLPAGIAGAGPGRADIVFSRSGRGIAGQEISLIQIKEVIKMIDGVDSLIVEGTKRLSTKIEVFRREAGVRLYHGRTSSCAINSADDEIPRFNLDDAAGVV